MSLSKLEGAGVAGGFLAKSMNTTMTRREFLQMSGALLLTVLGVQSLISTFAKHTGNTSPVSLLAGDPNGFGSRKFGQ